MMAKPIHPNLPPQIGRLLKPGLRFGQAVYSAAQMHEYADAYADLAVAAERERCAKLCEEMFSFGALEIAGAIRGA